MAESAKFHLKDGREVMFCALQLSRFHRRLGELIFGFVAIILLALGVLALTRPSTDRLTGTTSSRSDTSLASRAGS